MDGADSRRETAILSLGALSPKNYIRGANTMKFRCFNINLRLIRIAIEIEEGIPNRIHRYGNYFVINRNPF